MTEINDQDIEELIRFFSKNTYGVTKQCNKSQSIMQMCKLLVSLDYIYTILDNTKGDLNNQYPSQIILLDKEKFDNQNINDIPMQTDENITKLNKIKENVRNALIARCRRRFPIPVILYQNKHICRSSTTAHHFEVLYRLGIKTGYSFIGFDDELEAQNKENEVDSKPENEIEQNEKIEDAKKEDEKKFKQILDSVRAQDIELLKTFDVEIINDLMVENKKQKYGIYITSSEKADSENRYCQFKLVSIPYPGCEFFEELRKNNYSLHNLHYNWDNEINDAIINVPDNPKELGINWMLYRDWEIKVLTENYMLLLIKYLTNCNKGLLVHCISGWDRTPLFISMLRLSLWADGVVHTSLNALQITYFTIAYDWYLFGHDLCNRLDKKEEIFCFCFLFISCLCNPKFSVHKVPDNFQLPSNVRRSGIIQQQQQQQQRRSKTKSVSESFEIVDSAEFLGEYPPSEFSLEEDEPMNGNLHPHVPEQSPNRGVFQQQQQPSQVTGSNGCYYSGGGGSSPRSPTLAPDRTPPRPTTGCSMNRTPPKRTSPVPVPVPRLRQRTESTSSDSSFCMITETGSFPSEHSLVNQFLHEELEGNIEDSTATVIDETSLEFLMTRRHNRLLEVKKIFHRAYGKAGCISMDERSIFDRWFNS